MKLRSTINGGYADVDPECAERMIASGYFEAVVKTPPKPARKTRSRKTKAAPKEPNNEE
ncbi:head-to-tail connector [Mycobacterium phage MissWhite]|nr:head-to-tail connector [Mycobacterium phage MissWhite]